MFSTPQVYPIIGIECHDLAPHSLAGIAYVGVSQAVRQVALRTE